MDDLSAEPKVTAVIEKERSNRRLPRVILTLIARTHTINRQSRHDENTGMEINSPDAHAEITDAFQRYVDAINANDIDTVIALFWNSEQTLRYGGGENLYGIDEIKAFRNGQRGKKIKLEVTRLVITAFGPEFGTANCELRYLDTGTPGRMSHTWVRFSQGWRIVAAHVSPGPAA